MYFRMIYDEKLAQAAYLIGCQRTGEAILIDPERDVDRYLELAEEEDLRIAAVAETHIHADFLSGARELAERTGAVLYLSGEGGPEWSYRWLDRKAGGGAYEHRLLRDGDSFQVGNIRLTALHTPGHTPEHLSFLVTDLGGGADEPMGVATGDFVFVGDLGRPDLLETAAGQQGASEPAARRLFASLDRFRSLPEFLQVWPGHGAGSACGKALGAVPQTTVGYEKRFNGALSIAARGEQAFVETILAGQPEPPLYFARMKRLNRDGVPLLGELPVPAPVAPEALAADPAAVVLDTRPWDAFRAGHLPGALYAPLNKNFPTVAGSYVDPESRAYLVVPPDQAEEAVRNLVRVGIDRVEGFVTPEALEAYLAAGGERQTTGQIEPAELAERVEAGALVLDVRGAAELETGAVPGAIQLAHTRLPERIAELPRDRELMVYCQSGNRSAMAAAYLQRQGYAALNVAGGYSSIRQAGRDRRLETAGE